MSNHSWSDANQPSWTNHEPDIYNENVADPQPPSSYIGLDMTSSSQSLPSSTDNPGFSGFSQNPYEIHTESVGSWPPPVWSGSQPARYRMGSMAQSYHDHSQSTRVQQRGQHALPPDQHNFTRSHLRRNSQSNYNGLGSSFESLEDGWDQDTSSSYDLTLDMQGLEVSEQDDQSPSSPGLVLSNPGTDAQSTRGYVLDSGSSR